MARIVVLKISATVWMTIEGRLILRDRAAFEMGIRACPPGRETDPKYLRKPAKEYLLQPQNAVPELLVPRAKPVI